MRNYFLCSQAVIDHLQPVNVSKPFKSGYSDDTDNYYVAELEYYEASAYYDEVIEPYNEKSRAPDIDFWFRECGPGSISVDSITLEGIQENGLFREIEIETGLTNEQNRALIIWNLANEMNITPIDFINKIRIKTPRIRNC